MMMKKLIFTLIIISSFSSFAFAAEGDGFQAVSDNPNDPNFQLPSSQIVPRDCATKENPKECGWDDLVRLGGNILNFIIYISAFLAVLAFCYAGFLYMTAFGNMGKVEEAHKIFGSAIVGVFFVLAGWLIVATILKILVSDGGDKAGINTVIEFKGVDTIGQ